MDEAPTKTLLAAVRAGRSVAERASARGAEPCLIRRRRGTRWLPLTIFL